LAAEDELALELFAAISACDFGFAVVEFAAFVFELPFALVVLLPLELLADDCPTAARGEAHPHISASAQPTPSHLRIFARCFRFGSKGKPQKISGQRSLASKTLCPILSAVTDH
jgi:hypothetical protein